MQVCTAFTECYEDGVQCESDIDRLQGVAPKDGGALEGISVEREERVMESRRIANIASLTGGNVNGRLCAPFLFPPLTDSDTVSDRC